MCFVHSGSGLVQRAVVGEATAAAFAGVAAGGWSVGAMDVAASGTPETVAGPGGAPVLDGYRQVLHNRWNRDLPPAAVVRPGQEIQLLCRDALDIGEAGRSAGAPRPGRGSASAPGSGRGPPRRCPGRHGTAAG